MIWLWWIGIAIATMFVTWYIHGCVNPRCPNCGGRKSYKVAPTCYPQHFMRQCSCNTLFPGDKWKKECKQLFWAAWCCPLGFSDFQPWFKMFGYDSK